MKRAVLWGSLLSAAAVVLFVILFWFFRPLSGHISAFSYRYGHYWYGYTVYSVYTEGGQLYAKHAFETTDGMEDPTQEPWELTLPLTDEESAAFDQLILRDLRLPRWKESYVDPNITDMDSWSITYTWDGTEYATGGYAVYPEGLREIGAFFAALDWPPEP